MTGLGWPKCWRFIDCCRYFIWKVYNLNCGIDELTDYPNALCVWK